MSDQVQYSYDETPAPKQIKVAPKGGGYEFDADECLERHKAGQDAMALQLISERQDIEFQIPEKQWDADARAARQGSMSGRPARPMISISKIQQPQQLIKNQVTSSHLGVEVHPLSEDANDDTAKVFQGLYRKIQRDSKANQARMWAFDRAVICGSGVYEIATEYDESSNNPLDQKIVINRVLYQDQVVWDPAATKPDFSDGEYAFLDSWMPLKEFKRRFPDATVSTLDPFSMENVSRSAPGWITQDGKQKGIRVSKYWCKHHVEVEKPYIDEDGMQKVAKRDDVQVYWSLVAAGENGLEKLDGDLWNGRFIPLVPVIGVELQIFDGQRRRIGVTTNAKDAQRLYNYAATSATEMALLETKAPWLGPEGTFAGHMNKWNTANVNNWSTLEYKPIEFKGTILPPPQRISGDMSRLGPSLALLDKADSFIQSMTYSPDATLGQLDPAHRSGKALQTLVSQSEASSSNYANNLVEVSMPLEADIILDLIPKVYDRPGRLTHILDFEDKSQPVILNAPFVKDPNTGKPMQVQPGQQQMAGSPAPKTYNLAEGRYGTTITIGKSYQSRLEAGQDKLGELLQAAPDMMPILGSIFFKFSDDPWAQEASKIMEKIRNMKYPFLAESEDGQEGPDQLKSKLQALTGQMQAMQQQLQAAGEAIKTDQIKVQGDIEKEKIRAQVDLEKTKMDNDTRIKVAEIAASTKLSTSDLEAKVSLILDRTKAEQDAFNQRHVHDLGHEEMAHELGKTIVDHGHEKDMDDRAKSHEMAMVKLNALAVAKQAQDQSSMDAQNATAQAEQQAALAPAPDQSTGEEE